MLDSCSSVAELLQQSQLSKSVEKFKKSKIVFGVTTIVIVIVVIGITLGIVLRPVHSSASLKAPHLEAALQKFIMNNLTAFNISSDTLKQLLITINETLNGTLNDSIMHSRDLEKLNISTETLNVIMEKTLIRKPAGYNHHADVAATNNAVDQYDELEKL